MGYSHVLASSQTADPSVWCGSAINRSLEISLVDGNLKISATISNGRGIVP